MVQCKLDPGHLIIVKPFGGLVCLCSSFRFLSQFGLSWVRLDPSLTNSTGLNNLYIYILRERERGQYWLIGSKYRSYIDGCLLPKKGYSYFEAPSLNVWIRHTHMSSTFKIFSLVWPWSGSINFYHLKALGDLPYPICWIIFYVNYPPRCENFGPDRIYNL